MRLIFYYVAHRNAKYYLEDFFPTEGYYRLLERMVETGIVDEVLVIAESGKRLPAVEYMPGFTGYVMPAVKDVPGGLREDDIIWVRGGWKSWYPFLEKISPKHWMLFYGANTGRERWPFWDIIFDDLDKQDYIDGLGRIHLDFRKPTHPGIFYPMALERKYDLCIGSSHIHDKKGQWRGIKAAIAYQHVIGEKLKCVLPGSFRRGVMTNSILDDIRKYDLDVELPGMLPRDELRAVYNESKLFVHLGTGGQGDRGALEAMRCGCPVMIGFTQYHSPFTYANSDISYVAADPDHFETLAHEIHVQIGQSTEEKRKRVFEYHEGECGIETVSLPRMKKLFSLLKKLPKSDKHELLRRI